MIKKIISHIQDNKELLQVAAHFRHAADLRIDGGAADYAMSSAFNEAGYKGVSRKTALIAANMLLSLQGAQMSEIEIARRKHLYMTQWREGAARRERESKAHHRPPPGTSLIRT